MIGPVVSAVPANYNILAAYRAYLRDRNLLPTMWSMAFGSFGLIFYAASIVAVIALIVRVSPDRTDVRSPVPEPLR